MRKDIGKDLVAIEEDERPKLRSLLPTITEPRCNICKSRQRQVIDQLLVMGHGPASLAKQFKGTEDCFGASHDSLRKSFERHGNKHLNVEEEAIKKTIEARARERGILVEYTEEKLSTAKGVLDLIVSKGHEQIVEPGARIKYQDVLKAVELLEEYESNSFAVEVDELQRQMWAIREAVRKVCPPELFPELARVAAELYEGGDPFVDPREVIEIEAADETA